MDSQASLIFCFQRSLAVLIACENKFSPIRLHNFRSFVAISEVASKMYCTRFEKYPSKLDISRSFVAIFVLSKRYCHERVYNPTYRVA